jgi:hypothetical protein
MKSGRGTAHAEPVEARGGVLEAPAEGEKLDAEIGAIWLVALTFQL